MHLQHISIVLIGMGAGFLGLTYFLSKAYKTVFSRNRDISKHLKKMGGVV